MNIYAGSMCENCGRTARQNDRKPHHRCHKCGARLKPNVGKNSIERKEVIAANPYKTFWRRCLAFIIDSILIAIVSFPLEYLSGNVEYSLAWLFVLASIIFGPLYVVLCHFKYGQTIGKWIVKIKVVDLSESRLLTIGKSFMRSIIPVIVASFYCLIQLLISAQFWLGFSLSMELQIKMMTILLVSFILVSGIQIAWGVLELITMLFSAKQRALHDFLAHSVVVKCGPA